MGADNAGRLSRGQPNLDSPGEFVILARVKQRLALVALLALVAGAAWLLARRATGPQLVSGTVEVDVVRVASRTGGRVVALHAREGDALHAGQLLAELDAPEVVARREEAAAHLAELCDHLDVDGNLLITNDPFLGVGCDKGVLSFANAPERLGLRVCSRVCP